MALALGIVALGVVIVGVTVAIVLAGRQADIDAAPQSAPTDFVAPVSSGGFAWRQDDESPEQFRERVARAEAEANANVRTS
jgi:hypothetical protein